MKTLQGLTRKASTALAAIGIAVSLLLSGCATAPTPAPTAPTSWVDQAVIYEVNLRQYTEEGTFNAFSKSLPRLKALGVDILWFMPVQPISKKNRKGTLGSYYSIADYTGINPEYGNKADFKAMVDQAHELGFKVVLDWVANHSGWDNPWIKAHPDWYTKDAAGKITWPIGTDWTDVADLNYDSQEMRAEMIASMKYWVTEFNIDGFRCDVAGEVPADFWAMARAEIETVKSIWMVAENSDEVDLLNTFDANYGWPLQGVMQDLAKSSFANDLFESKINGVYSSYPPGKYPMNFITNHDENSWKGTEFGRYGDAVDLMAIFYFTMPGMPLIYSGQEVGFNRKLAFFEKDLIVFTDSGLPDHSFTEFYQRLIKLKDSNPALWNGSAGGDWQYLESDNSTFVAYARTLGTNRVLVVMNLSVLGGSAHVTFDGATGTDLSGEYLQWPSNAKVNLNNGYEFSFEEKGYAVFTQGSNQ